MKRLLILGAGEMQVPIIIKARQLGIYTLVLDISSNAPGLKFANEYDLISTTDKEAILEYAKNKKLDGILTTSDFPVNCVAFVAAQLKLPAMSEDVASICTNKYLQRTIFFKNGINVPYFELFSRDSDFSHISRFPLIVKPIDSSASRGVRRVNNAEELTDATIDAFKYSRSGYIIIESYIDGREFSVETITQDNITHFINITEKLTIGNKEGYFVEDTHIEPARISNSEYLLIKQEILKAINSIGLNNCPAHTEIKISHNMPYIIEIACRLGGDYIASDLIPLSTGIDMLENLINLSLGKKITIEPVFKKSALIQFINCHNYDNCLRFIKLHKDIIVRYEVKPFHTREIHNSLDRMGYIILQSNSEIETNKLLQELNQ